MFNDLTFEHAMDIVRTLSTPYATGEEALVLRGSTIDECSSVLLLEPQDRAVGLMRTYFQAPERLSDAARSALRAPVAQWTQAVAAAAGMPAEELLRSTREGDPTFAVVSPPETFDGYWYHGAFKCGGALTVADRVYAGERKPLLSVRMEALPGRWYVFVRLYAGPFLDDPRLKDRDDAHFALLVVHEEHFSRAKERGVALGGVGVDAGCVVVIDSAAGDDPGMARRLATIEPWIDGLLWGFGCTSSTLLGDGVFEVFAVTENAKAVVVRVNLTSEPYFDHFDSPEATKALERKLADRQRWLEQTTKAGATIRAYSPKETFAAGDIVRHDKFGVGQVIGQKGGGKVEILFEDQARVLVHGRQ
jgi:hypothetical protein